jgi:tRNA dimethylallyltransferase
VDLDAAERIHPNDLHRIIRALEIVAGTGAPASSLRAAHGFDDRPYRTLHLALDPGRERLNERIDRRCCQMIDAGLLREARALREAGYGPELRPLRAIGYRHMAAVVDGHDTLASALPEMQRDTRRFARRQRTWLRKVEGVLWFDPEDEEEILATVERFLTSAVESESDQ